MHWRQPEQVAGSIAATYSARNMTGIPWVTVAFMAMQATVTHQFPVMFRAEYVAAVSPDLCNGCRQCMRLCQFGAIGYSAANRKAEIDPRRCYGCGICRAACKKDAIRLEDRARVPAAANLWQ